MKTKALSLLLVGSILAVAAWFAHAPNEAQAVAVPEECRETIRKGLDYLAGKQLKDGHWEADGGAHPVAMTALAGLALLMSTHGPDHQIFGKAVPDLEHGDKHSASVRKATDWLMAQSQPGRDGLIFSGHDSETTRYMQGHGLATIFLAGVCQREVDAERQRKLTEVLARAVRYIASAQSTQGGWHDTSKAEGHDFASIPATVIQIQALHAAASAGIPTPPGVADDSQVYLKKSLEKGVGIADTAAALACLARPRRNIGKVGGSNQAKIDAEKKWFEDCRKGIPVGKDLTFGRSEFVHYYYAQAEHHLGGDAWVAYRTKMFNRLRDSQKADGSWPASQGACTGPVYATAVWCTILQLDNDSHPSRQRMDFVTD